MGDVFLKLCATEIQPNRKKRREKSLYLSFYGYTMNRADECMLFGIYLYVDWRGWILRYGFAFAFASFMLLYHQQAIFFVAFCQMSLVAGLSLRMGV